MKKFLFVSLLLVFVLTGCSELELEPIPWDQISFDYEPNPNKIGSYSISRTNLEISWQETGEWNSTMEMLFSPPVVCFEYFTSDNHGTFWHRSDYHWVEVEQDNRLCLKLEKRKE